MTEQTKIRYWAFKHKDGTEGTMDQTIKLIRKAMASNVALMQYEYGLQGQGAVTLNWNKIRQLKLGDYLFLRGNDRVYAVGQIIAPRRKASVTLSIEEVIKSKSHGDYCSNKSTEIIRFEDSEVFYEDLADGTDGWGQRIDVDKWMYYNPNGIGIQSNDNFLEGENAYPVIRELKSDKAVELINNLKSNFMIPATQLLLENQNLILTGAPGTGKTYLAKQIAAQLILGKNYSDLQTEEELIQFNSQCGFVQFHPSYDYTDFIEGLRPVQKKECDTIGFERMDGVFKSFCREALENKITCIQVPKSDGTEQTIRVKSLNKLNLSILYNHYKGLGKTDISDQTRDDLFNVIIESPLTKTKTIDYAYYQVVLNRLLSADYKDCTDFEQVYNDFKQKIQDNKMIELCINDRSYTIALTARKQIGVCVLANVNQPTDSVTNMDPNEGDNKYVFIIDEINRGEISKIMGELFFAIDPGYRGKCGLVKTQYHNLLDNEDDVFNDGFYVPENVYIIGTMNDIDRSVESMDFAMRRRFAWSEVKASDRIAMWDGIFDESTKEEMKNRMIRLNTAIEEVPGLSEAYHIGPAYFLKLKNDSSSLDRFDNLWNNHLKGVLFEYLRGMPNAKDKLEVLKKAFDLN